MNVEPTRLFRSPDDARTHALKGRVLGISAEDHARLMHLFLKCRIDSKEFRGLQGEALSARIREVWERTFKAPATPGLPSDFPLNS